MWRGFYACKVDVLILGCLTTRDTVILYFKELHAINTVWRETAGLGNSEALRLSVTLRGHFPGPGAIARWKIVVTP